MLLRLIIGVYFGCAVVDGAPARDPLAQPNIFVIMADDMAWGDLGIHGNSVLDTPILDEMAKSGVRLDRFYVSPASAPTSAS
ncbi:MAG: sulfatase-like hydrolase/transferase, partial [Verrucomicrobiota bacterium]